MITYNHGEFQTLFNRLLLKKDPFDAVDFPRIHHQLIPGELFYEEGFPKVNAQSMNLNDSSAINANII